MKRKQNKKRFTISLPCSLYELIAAEARAANLTLTDAFQQILEKALNVETK